MKIRKITFVNHPVFGEITIDFTDKDGNIVDTVILAGENGVGKSLILNSIYEFTQLSISEVAREELRTFEIQLSSEDIRILTTYNSNTPLFVEPIIDNIFQISIDYKITNWQQCEIRGKTSSGFSTKLPSTTFQNPQTQKILKSVFSDTEINFTAQQINTVTSTNIDNKHIHRIRSGNNTATEISQLLIDIQTIDAIELNDWAKQNIGKPVDSDKIDKRMKRFTSAFNYMFPTKKFKGIETIQFEKQIIFEENGKEMSINNLSSGEKQIVFRGSFLLKDRESLKEAVILVDEPELSLHPNWQLKILSFLKKLYTNSEGKQTSQIIISTHSPFIIHNANRNNDKVIILQKNSTGQINIADDPKFFTWSVEKKVQEAFNISNFVNNNKTTIFLEGQTDEQYFNTCLSVFAKTGSPIEFKWIGRINDQGNAENTGDTALNQAKTFFTSNSEQIQGKIVLLYDNDTNKTEETIGNLFIRKMLQNKSNKTFKIGVENLLILKPKSIATKFYSKRIKKDNYNAESVIRELDKSKLCNYICTQLNERQQKIVLLNIDKEVNRILEIIQPQEKINSFANI